jgi:signal transduction histidine kinase
MSRAAQSLVHEVRLREFLAQRLRPLVLLLAVTISISAPVAFYVFGVQAARAEADAVARRVAETLRRDAQQRPTLWQYDSPKLLEHLRAFEAQENIERIDVVDALGAPIDPVLPEDARALVRAAVVWSSAPVRTGADAAGAVWVAATTAPVRNGAFLLAVPFALLAAVLAGSLRAMSRADARIGTLIARLEESQQALATLNENLEGEVELRSAELARAYEDLQALSGRAVNLQESERRAIARELHDSAGQALTAIRINLQVVASGANAPEPVRALAEKTMGMVDGTLEEIRRAVRVLGPAVLDDIGFRAALERLCEDMSEGQAHTVTLHADLPEGQELLAAVETTAYRVVQEALTNVSRHAAARTVDVHVSVGPQTLEVRVEDDGRGFDPGGDFRSRGLVGMRERAELIGGTLAVDSAPGGGVRLRATLPLRTGQYEVDDVVGSKNE